MLWYKNYSRTPFIRLPIYPDLLGLPGLIYRELEVTCVETTGYRIKYSTVL
jgi:hypothetical protein